MATEFYVVYSTTTGEIEWRAQGDQGSAAMQRLSDGLAAAVIPEDAWTSADPVEASRDYYRSLINASASALFRALASTSVEGQDRRYLIKEAQARAWTAEAQAINPNDFVFLTKESEISTIVMGVPVSIQQVRDEILTQVNAARLPEAIIEGMRVAHRKKVTMATTMKDLVDAATIDWSAALGSVQP